MRCHGLTNTQTTSAPAQPPRRSRPPSARDSNASAAETACPVSRSSRELPGRHRIAAGVLAVLKHHAHLRELVADAVGFLEVFSHASGGARRNEGFYLASC